MCVYVSFSSFSSAWIRCQVTVLSPRVHAAASICSPWKRYGGPRARSESANQVIPSIRSRISASEGVGAVAPELLAVYIGHPTNSVTGTPRALVSFTTTRDRTS